MGAFKCRCGNILRSNDGSACHFLLLADDPARQQFAGAVGDGSAGETRFADALTECRNCGRAYRETAGEMITYVPDESLPRVWADFSIRDEMGRVLLDNRRSMDDVRRQKLILNPPVMVTLYDGDRECDGECNFGLNSDGGFDRSLWAVTLLGDE